MPDEAAVLGVGNDEVYCDLSSIPLSSVRLDTYFIGYEAAAMLRRLMSGESAPLKPMLVPPVEVSTRRSTDVLALADSRLPPRFASFAIAGVGKSMWKICFSGRACRAVRWRSGFGGRWGVRRTRKSAACSSSEPSCCCPAPIARCVKSPMPADLRKPASSAPRFTRASD